MTYLYIYIFHSTFWHFDIFIPMHSSVFDKGSFPSCWRVETYATYRRMECCQAIWPKMISKQSCWPLLAWQKSLTMAFLVPTWTSPGMTPFRTKTWLWHTQQILRSWKATSLMRLGEMKGDDDDPDMWVKLDCRCSGRWSVQSQTWSVSSFWGHDFSSASRIFEEPSAQAELIVSDEPSILRLEGS